MSALSNLLNKNVNPSAGGPGVTSDISVGKQRSFFLQPDVMASSLSTTLSSNLHIKGQSKSTDANGVKYPNGFTPEVDYYVDPDNKDNTTGSPVERGVILNAGIINSDGSSKYGSPKDTNDILDTDVVNAFDAFDEGSNYEFIHHLDRGEIPIGIKLSKDSDIYLSSFVETDTDNEDPVSFGYDIIIDYDNSPLFNGSVEDFINTFSSYSEISSRLDIITKFKIQFFKFFEINIQNLLNLEQPRTYYLLKLSGLDNLTESISSEKPKQFVDYGKDLITLTLREDVSVNTGYLATLYKLLTWSRVHGKKMIPDNLLRFDVEIVVTESRKFNRVRKNQDNTLDQFADLMSRYRYKLYECQFFFDRLSHGNDIDISDLGLNAGFDIQFNYKYTTLRFEKFTESASSLIGTDIIRDHVSIDNSLIDISKVDPKNSNSFTVDNNNIVTNPISYVLNKYTPVGEATTYNPIGLDQNSAIPQTINPIDLLNQTATTPDAYQAKLANMSIPGITTITKQNSLLQRTLQNIESSFSADLKRAIYTLKQDLTDFIPSNIVGGFTEDGYEYNIPAYYTNKAFNTVNNTLKKSLDTVRKDIYEQKNIFVQTELMGINNAINTGDNTLNHLLGKLNPMPGSNGRTQNIYNTEDVVPNDSTINKRIYGDTRVSPYVYVGSDKALTDPTYIPTPNKHIYDHDVVYPDIPVHKTGNPLNIYEREINYPDIPVHNTGAPTNIYTFEPNYEDIPTHNKGISTNIYNFEPIYPDEPEHNMGVPIDIYSFNPNYPDIPIHNVGTPVDIYDFNPNYPDTPEHSTGDSINIYENKKEYPNIPEHTKGTPLNIYDKK